MIIAETGGDMSAFPTAKHLASWAGVCPGNDESAGKRRSGKARKGSKWLGANLIEAATAASRTKDTYLQAQYQRLRARRGHARAITALAHSMRVAAWHGSSPPASSTAIRAATTSPSATPNARPDGSSPTSRSRTRASRQTNCRQGGRSAPRWPLP